MKGRRSSHKSSKPSKTCDPQPVDAAASTGQLEPVDPRHPAPVDALLTLVHGSATTVEPAGLVSATQPEVVLHVTVGDLARDQPGPPSSVQRSVGGTGGSTTVGV